MKVLIVSNMYPSNEKPYSGIFVKNQYLSLKEFLSDDISIYYLPRSFTNGLGSIIKYIKFFLGFGSFLFTKYDVVHFHFAGFHVFLGFIYKFLYPNSNFVITFHGSDTKNVLKPIFRFVFSKANNLIAVGEGQASYISKNLGNRKVHALSAGVDRSIFYKESSIEKVYDFIFVGSFYEVKGVDIFVDSLHLLEDFPFSICFVGSGIYEDKIKELCGKGKIDIFYGISQNKIRNLINLSKYLVLPSRGDSFGLVVTESMYCGVPVIVSNLEGLMQQVDNLVNGFILEENTSNCLSNYLLKAYNLSLDDYIKMSTNALNSNDNHSMQSICKQLVEIYNKK